MEQLEPGSAVYNFPGALMLEGRLDLEVLERVINEIVRRHEILRTRFEVEEGEPVQVIDEWKPGRLEVEDLTNLIPEEREDEARRIASKEARTGFDLGRGPLLRAKALKLEEEKHVFLYMMHHIVTDGWSMGILVREVGTLYQAYRAGESSPLEELEIQYADFAVWQREWLKGELLEEKIEYWRKQLAGMEDLELPTDHPRPAMQSHRGAKRRLAVEGELTEKLRELGQREGVTMFMTLLAAFQTLLGRYSGQHDISTGTVIANRNHLETESLIGFFVNQLVLRIDLSGKPSFLELLRRVRQTVLESYAHQDLPFERLVEELAPKRDPSRSPLCQVVFALQNAPQKRLELPGLSLNEFEAEAEATKYDLTVMVEETPEGLAGVWEYCRDLFEEETIRRMIGHFQTLLRSVVGTPQRRLSELEILTEAEREQMLAEWNQTRREYPQDQCVHKLFEAQAMRTPDAVAVVDKEQELSYGELNRRADLLARYLRGLGVGPEVLVSLCLERSLEMVVGVLGALKAGGAYLPLDPGYPVERLAYMLEDGQAPVLLTQGRIADRLPVGWTQVVLIDEWEQIETGPETVAQWLSSAENLAYVIYTSGSTGRPKGVCITHRGLMNYLSWALEAYPVNEPKAIPLHSSLSFDLTVTSLYLPLLTGGKVSLLREDGLLSPLSGALGQAHDYSLVKLTPGHLQMLNQEEWNEEGKVGALVIGGEALRYEDVSRWRQQSPMTKLINEYGPTETVVGSCIYEVSERDSKEGAVPIGRPIGNSQVYVLDGEGQVAPIGVSGELYIGGEGLGRGYLNRPDLTADRFVPNPFGAEAGRRLYRTGDLAKWESDGRLMYLGRTDEQVKVRGYRIELGEIEAVLCEHPGVRQSAVVVREDEPGLKNLVAYVVSNDSYNPPPGAYVLPNGMAVAQQNKNETEFLYEEIFERKQYLRYGIEIREESCVFDVGANIGLFTMFVGEHCPGARIYAFEPIEDIFQCLKQNAARYDGNVKVFHHGLSDREQEAKFTYYPRYSMMSRQEGHSSEVKDKELVERYLKNEQQRGVAGSEELLAHAGELLEGRFEGEVRTCRLRRLSDVIKEQGVERIDLLKIDVERAEEEVLGGIEDKDWEKIDQIVMEAHDEDAAGKQGRVQVIVEELERRGYVVGMEEDEHLRGTGLYNLYARREGVASVRKSDPAMPRREVGAAKAALTTTRLREYLQRRLPEYMVPAAFVMMEKLPLTPNGKKDRRALPAPNGVDTAREYEAPVGATETALARIWAEALKLERVGRYDHFFELGGHSLLAVRLIERMRREGLHADVRAIFATPTLAALAAAVGSDSGLIDVPPNRIPPGCEAITPEMLPLVELSAAEIERIVSAVPGGAANVQDIYPLAPLQEGILFHHLLESEGDVYLAPALLAFDSRARLERFLQALQAVVERHDILRTAVLWEGLREPVQVVWRQAPLMVEEVSINPMAGDVAKELRTRFDPRRYRIDIRRAPLVRVYIAHDPRERRWIMLHLFHHLAMDHTGLEILLEEIEAHRLGREEELPEPLPFRKFVAQARLGVSRQEHEAFFRQMLADVDEPTTPYGLIDVQGDGSGIKEARREVDAGLGNRLRQSARSLGVSAASLCHLAWAQVLARVSGREDVVFGTVLFGRMQGGEGANRVLGMLINTLPVRIRVGEESVEEGIRQTHTLLTQLLRHEHAPLALAQRCSAVKAPAPLFSAILNYRHSATLTEAGAGAQKAWEGIAFLGGEERVNYPFGLNVSDLGEEFELNAQVEAPINPDRICAYMHTALEQLVEALEQAPTTPVRNLNVLPDSERHQLLVEWNETGKPYPNNRRVHELFAKQAEQSPDQIALIGDDRWVSYRELNRRANQLAGYLQRLGVGPEMRVGLCLGRSIEMVVALMGVLKAGGAYLPLDPEYPPQRLSYMLEDAGVEVVLTMRELAARLPESCGQRVLMDVEWERIGWESESEPESKVGTDNLAYVIYTSGSTGKPKGVAVHHRALVARTVALLEAYELSSADRLLQGVSPSFDAFGEEVFPTLSCAAGLVIDQRIVHYTAHDLLDLIERLAITIIHTTVAFWHQFVDELSSSPQRVSQQLRLVIAGGESPSTEALKRWATLASHPSRFVNAYGPTEATITSTICGIEMGSSQSFDQARVPIGRPIANTQAYILDHYHEVAPVGVIGELYIGGAGVARGYLGRAEVSAEKFVPDSFGKEGGARLYRTGDMGRYLANGKIEFLGRVDEQVKLRGYRIELGEIEARLNEHRGVRQSVVVVREGARGGQRLLGYVVGEEGVTAAELKRHVRDRLPEYMVPEAILMLEEMPLTVNGKIDRRRLPVVEGAGRQVEQEYVAPRTPVEEILVGIFEEVLKLDRVGIHDNFFDIGGHSLLVTQVISRVRSTFEVAIEVKSIFEAATVAKLAEMLIAREPKPGQAEKIALILTKLSNMTDEDVDAELAALEQ